MKTLYTIHKTNNRKSINGFRKKLSHLERSHSNGTSSTRSHKRKNNINKKQYKNSKNSTGKVEKDVEDDARIA